MPASTIPRRTSLITAADSGVTIEGYHDSDHPDRTALIDRNGSSGDVFELQNADDVTLENLSITGRQSGDLRLGIERQRSVDPAAAECL